MVRSQCVNEFVVRRDVNVSGGRNTFLLWLYVAVTARWSSSMFPGSVKGRSAGGQNSIKRFAHCWRRSQRYIGIRPRGRSFNILRRLICYSQKMYKVVQMMEGLPDGRKRPRIKMGSIVSQALVMYWSRLGSLNSLESSRRSGFWKGIMAARTGSADTIGRVFGNMETDHLRECIKRIYTKLKRNKALGGIRGWIIGIVDGHETHASYRRHCSGCLHRKIKMNGVERLQFYHRNVTFMLVAGKFRLLLDMEPQRTGEGEVTTAIRLIRRVMRNYPRAFEIVLADALYAGAPFINFLWSYGIYSVVVLKQENREIYQDGMGLIRGQQAVPGRYRDRDCLWWDIPDLRSWDGIDQPMRIVRSEETYLIRRQLSAKQEQQNSQWMWITNMAQSLADTEWIVELGHRRWDIENKGFNELVNGWYTDHLYKHNAVAIEAFYLAAFIAYDLFHAFLLLNIKPELRANKTELFFVRLMAAEIFSDIPWGANCRAP